MKLTVILKTMKSLLLELMGDVMEGEDYTFWGQLTNHPKYGKQLQMTRYERSKPSASGLIKYFSSDNFKGIGKKTAERIVEIYGRRPYWQDSRRP